MIKKIIFPLQVILIVSILSLGNTVPVFADHIYNALENRMTQETNPDEPLPNINTYSNQATFTFSQIGLSSFELHYPFAKRFDLDLPYRWALAEDNELSYIEIRYDMYYFEDSRSANALLTANDSLPLLEVYIDGYFAAATIPQPGINQTFRVPIPYQVASNRDVNNHNIRLNYIRGRDCDRDEEALLVIHDTSTVHVNFETLPPILNLADFPRPLIQDSFIPESVLFILPDNFSATDLEAAAIISASIGRKAIGKVTPEVLTASQVTPEILSLSSAIVIGRPVNNAFLANLYTMALLPTRISSNGQQILGYGAQEISPEDGILQLAQSEVNPNNSYLVVTGNTDEGVLRAANALTQASPSLGLKGSVSVIESIYTPETNEDELVQVFTLEDLGIRESIFYGIGTQSTEFSFFIPGNWDIKEGTALVMNYAHSTQISPGNSTVTIELNRKPVGSLPLEENATGELQVIVPINPEDFNPGDNNRLTFNIVMDIDFECVDYDSGVAWIRIRETSTLQIPHDVRESGTETPFIVDPFFHLLDDSAVLFSLPTEPSSQEILTLLRFSQLYGALSPQGVYKFKVNMESEPNTDQFRDYDIVAIGLPTQNPMIQLVNDSLTQPFLEGTDTLKQEVGNITYRLTPDFSVGVIQVITSPWNINRGVSVISGTTEEALEWSMDVFTDEELIYELWGDVSFIQGDQIESIRSIDTTRSTLELVITDLTGQDTDLEPVPVQEEEEPTEAEEPSISTTLPDKYKTAESSLGTPLNIALFALIGVGILTGIVGIAVNLMKKRQE
jgi:hypothetical protein